MKVLFRVDASEAIGTGHLMRCIALAQEIKHRGFEFFFFTTESAIPLLQNFDITGSQIFPLANRFGESGHSPNTSDLVDEELRELSKLCALVDFDWIVIDGYKFDLQYQKALSSHSFNRLLIDDFGDLEVEAEVILNQNLGAERYANYIKPSSCLALLGTNYCLLRQEFISHIRSTCPQPRVTDNKSLRIIISLGGSDLYNLTPKVVKALLSSSGAGQVRIIVGQYYTHFADLSELCRTASNKNWKIELLQSVKNMVTQLSWSNCIITSVSTTVWEALALGSSLIVGVYAENQVRTGQELSLNNLAENVGDYQKLSSDELRNRFDLAFDNISLMKERTFRGLKLCDGLGCQRVIDILETFER